MQICWVSDGYPEFYLALGYELLEKLHDTFGTLFQEDLVNLARSVHENQSYAYELEDLIEEYQKPLDIDFIKLLIDKWYYPNDHFSTSFIITLGINKP